MSYNPTTPQHALKQSAIAGGLTVSATIIATAYQYVLGHGLNLPALLLFLAPFAAGQVATLWHTLTLSPQFKPAIADTVTNLPAEIAALPGAVGQLHSKFDRLIDYLTRQPTPQVPPATVNSAAMSTPIPQRPQFAAPVSPNSVVLPAVPTMLPQGQ